jgi:Tol biopolymer transport system component
VAAACTATHKTPPPYEHVTPGIKGPVRLVAWSPDGKRIAWYSGVRIWIANTDGSNAHPIAKGADSDCCWTLWWPRPKTIVYADDFRVFLLNTSGHTSRPIGTLGSYIWIDRRGTVGATQSPRGPWPIELVDLRGTKHRTYFVKTGGRKPDLVADAWPTLSPDGSRVAFGRSFCKTPDTVPCSKKAIWIASTSDGRGRQVFRDGTCPTWSPDGRRLLFVDSHRSLRVGDARGRNSRVVIQRFGSAAYGPCGFEETGRVAWSADGHYVADITVEQHSAPGSNPSRLQIVPLDSGRSRVLRQLGDGYQFAWSPVSPELLVVSTPPGNHPRACNSLWLIDARGGNPRLLRKCPH